MFFFRNSHNRMFALVRRKTIRLSIKSRPKQALYYDKLQNDVRLVWLSNRNCTLHEMCCGFWLSRKGGILNQRCRALELVERR